ncbi:MAG: CAP domain-containing protein [Candidatus Dojkabacteria bacterium]|nr:CAP domain-containing protein [Candidatus Dojkabacteria bacterium]MDQ7021617.1 CAP domain-containing protein [Candidatus Dojkabacteria bacterium]
MKNFFLPTTENNHRPHLLHINSLMLYIVILFSFNFLITAFAYTKTSASFEINELLESHNQVRESNGLSPLKLNTKLSISASNKGRVMLENNCWSHYCPDGKDWRDFFFDVDYDYIHIGENLAEGFTGVDSTMNAWMNSKTHRDNILNPNYEEIGFGIITGDYQGKSNNTILIVHFGKPASKSLQVAAAGDINSLNQELSIDSPVDGSIINTLRPEINGGAPTGDEVLLKVNQQEVGRILPNGGAYYYKPSFDLNEGENRINVSQINQDSKEIKISVDTEKPFLYLSDITYEKKNDNILIYIPVSEDISTLSLNKSGYKMKEIAEDFWRVTVSSSILDTESTLFYIEDLAGNKQQFELFSKDILNELNKTADEKEEIEGINVKSLKSSVAIIFILYLAILLLIDYFYLKKTNMLDVRRSKSHLHLSILLIAFTTLSIGGITGSIL